MKSLINYITNIFNILIDIIYFIFIGIIFISNNILHNIFMILTIQYKYLYFEETLEEKKYLDEINCYCNICVASKYICNCFVKKIKNSTIDLYK